MTQTAEERKIKRLEAQVKGLKAKVEELENTLRWKEGALHGESKWRRDFQRLMKDVVQEDIVEEYQIEY